MGKHHEGEFSGDREELLDWHENTASSPGGFTRTLADTIGLGRQAIAFTMDGVSRQMGRMVGTLRDFGDDIVSYVDPGTLLEDVYSWLGIASSGSIGEIDERMDDVEVKVDDVARQRAREELLLLQQRIGELETMLGGYSRGEAHSAMENVLDRLGELEARIDSLPVREAGSGLRAPAAASHKPGV